MAAAVAATMAAAAIDGDAHSISSGFVLSHLLFTAAERTMQQ